MILLDSPNQRDRPGDVAIDTLILHYTGMQSGHAAIERLCDPAAAVSSHYVIEEDGRIFRLVEESRRAAHAGISVWQGRSMLNDSSIGIEIVNPGHEWGYRPYPAAQVAALRRLCHDIFGRHPIPPERVLGHSDVAPDRKQDPGELFPWQALATDGIGIWPDEVPGSGQQEAAWRPPELAPLRRALGIIGYDVEEQGDMDDGLATILRAFQRHWRPQAVTGRADRGTAGRIEAVAAGMTRARTTPARLTGNGMQP